jgi:hypothetical protein
VNFALFYDGAMFLSLWEAAQDDPNRSKWMIYLACWIFCSKLVKPLPHYIRNPCDMMYIPFAIAFGYFHSLIKLYALVTFYVTAWGTRQVQ